MSWLVRHYSWCVVCSLRAIRTPQDNVCELCFAEILNDFDGGLDD